MIGSFFYARRTNKDCYVHVMCKMLVLRAKTGQTSANFLRFDIKLKKSRTGFEFGYGPHLRAKLFSTSRLAGLAS